SLAPDRPPFLNWQAGSSDWKVSRPATVQTEPMDQLSMQEKVRRLEQELQFRVPGSFSFGAVGGGFNVRGSCEALNYRSAYYTTAPPAPPTIQSMQTHEAPPPPQQPQPPPGLLCVSNVASIQDEPQQAPAADDEAASSRGNSRLVSQVFSDFTEDEESDGGGGDGSGPGRRSESPASDFEEVPIDTADGGGGSRIGAWRSAAAAAAAVMSGRPASSSGGGGGGGGGRSTAKSAASTAAAAGLSEYIDVNISDTKHPPAVLPPQPEGLAGNRLKRRKVFESLLATEASYLASLRELLDVYEQPLLKHKPKLLPRRATRLIFYKVRELHQIHRILQISLHAAALSWDTNEQVGHILTASFSKSLVLKTYAAFINTYPRGLELVRRQMKDNAPFASFLGTAQRRSSHKLPLLGILVRPVQRFPQLLLVVKDLLKYTEPDHPDRYDLLYAQTQIEHLASQLNDIKRDSEQLISARQMLRALGVHSKSALKNSRIRIVREDDVSELRADRQQQHAGGMRIILTTYYVLCTGARRRGGPQELLWYTKLEDVRLSGTSLTPDMKVNLEEVSNYLRIVSQRSTEVPEELEEIYNSLHSLLHDHAVLVKILSLVSTLNFIYPDVREDRLQALLGNMQVAIQQKNEELRVAQGTVLALTVRRGILGGGGGEVSQSISRKAFDMRNSRARDDWTSEFTILRLALQPENNAAWITEMLDDLGLQSHQRTPLLVGVKACDLSRSMFQVTCATPVCLLNGSILKTHIWCAASDGSVAVFSLYNQSLEMTETFRPVDAYVTAAAVVPGCPTSSQNKEDEVWMATDTAEIFLHSTVESKRREPRKKVDVPATVTSMLCWDKSIYCGDVSGNLLCFNQNLLGNWNLQDPEVQSIADWPLRNLTVSQDGQQLLMSSGPCIISLGLESLRQLSRTDLSLEDADDNDEATKMGGSGGGHVRSFLLAGEGLWVCFENRPYVRLYYRPDMRLVQTFDIRPAFAKVNAKTHRHPESTVPAATAVAVTRGLLWVGTSVGLLYLLRTPRLDGGVPVAFGPPLICCHSHRGPITALLTYRNIKDTVVSTVTFDEQEAESEPGAGEADGRAATPSDAESSGGLDSSGSTSGLYRLKMVVDEAEAADAADDAAAAAIRRKSTAVARVSVAPNMQRWASNPNLLISERLRNQQLHTPETDVRKLYGSLLQLDSGCSHLVDIDFGDAAEASSVVGAEDEKLSDIEEEEAVNDVVDAAAAAIGRVGPEIVVSFGPGYRDMLHRPQCPGEEGASLMAFYSTS
ncbi:hypothetical protein BOX15_Mlig005772g1, partial [Macrostomum lignano]